MTPWYAAVRCDVFLLRCLVAAPLSPCAPLGRVELHIFFVCTLFSRIKPLAQGNSARQETRKSGKCNMSFYRSGSETNHGAVGRATLLKPGSLASLVPFKGFAEERELRERMLLKSFLARHGFPSLHRPREFGPSAVLRIEHLYPIHVAARKGDADMVRIMLKNGADADVTHGGSNALDMAQEEDEDGSHLEVLQVLADLLELKCQTF